MALLRKVNIARPTVRKETVEVEELGGEVIVRGTMLDERLALVFGVLPPQPVEGDAPVEAAPEDPRAQYGHIARLLAYAVVDADGEPIFSAADWQEFGGLHYAATLRLYGIAKRLSGMDTEAGKKN